MHGTLNGQDLPEQRAAGLGRVHASGSSSPSPGSTLLLLALITGSAAGTVAGNKIACCYQVTHTFIATLIDMLLKARIIGGNGLSLL